MFIRDQFPSSFSSFTYLTPQNLISTYPIPYSSRHNFCDISLQISCLQHFSVKTTICIGLSKFRTPEAVKLIVQLDFDCPPSLYYSHSLFLLYLFRRRHTAHRNAKIDFHYSVCVIILFTAIDFNNFSGWFPRLSGSELFSVEWWRIFSFIVQTIMSLSRLTTPHFYHFCAPPLLIRVACLHQCQGLHSRGSCVFHEYTLFGSSVIVVTRHLKRSLGF